MKRVMNKNEIAGKAEQVKGSAKQKVGKWTGQKDLEAAGAVDRATGKVRETVGMVEREIDEAVDEFDDAAGIEPEHPRHRSR